jgi:hypothetical protein
MHVERTRDGLAARVVQRDVSEVAWPHVAGETSPVLVQAFAEAQGS